MRDSIEVWLVGTVLSGLAAGACGSEKGATQDDAREGVPEQSAYQLSITDDAASEALATDADAVDPAAEIDESLTDAATLAEVAPELQRCRHAVVRLNQGLRTFMQPIVALVRNTEPSATQGNVRTWGPVTRGATEFRFLLRHGALRHYGWLLEARPAMSADQFLTVAAGGITVGFRPRRGTGTIGLDLDRLATVDPTVTARGQLLARFAHGPNGSLVGYRLASFTPDPSVVPGMDALVQGLHLSAGYNRLRLAFQGNVPETATDAPELVLARVRARRDEGGRADLLITGGDVPAGKTWVVSECWNAELAQGYRIVRECPTGDLGAAECLTIETNGDLPGCGLSLRSPELPPADPTATMPDPESPVGDVVPPDAMPNGAPPDEAAG